MKDMLLRMNKPEQEHDCPCIIADACEQQLKTTEVVKTNDLGLKQKSCNWCRILTQLWKTLFEP